MNILAPLALLACAVLTPIIHQELRRRRIARCGGCFVESEGGSRLGIVHTCSKNRTPYRDRNGRLWEFGREVKEVISAR